MIFLAFLLSGVAGLMHEVVWARQLVQLIGSTAYARTAVLAVFMGGLALGALVFGRRVDRVGRPLHTYVVLEVLIAIYGLLIPLLLKVAGSGYIALSMHFFESGTLKLLLRFVLAILVVITPAVLMGGTLPILARSLTDRVKDTRQNVGRLYALNSFGAVIGAGVAGFVALPLLGVYPSLVIASLLNLAAGFIVAPLARRELPGVKTHEVKQENKRPKRGRSEYRPVTYAKRQFRVALLALALSGFAAMGYEVLFIRVIGLSFASTTHSFTVMLMCFITGIALGSYFVARRHIKRPLWVLGVSQLIVIMSIMVVTPLLARLPYFIDLARIGLRGTSYGFEAFQFAKTTLCLAVLLLPTTCLGFMFPLVAHVQARQPRHIGSRVGETYAWNTIGNVLGVVTTSLVFLPILGMLNAFHVNFALNAAAGVALLVVGEEVRRARRFGVAGIALGVVVIYLAIGTSWSETITLTPDHFDMAKPDRSLSASARANHPSSSFDAWKRYYLLTEMGWRFKFVYLEEDAHNTVLVFGPDRLGDDTIVLSVNNKTDASTVGDLDTQLLLAHAPMFLVPEARSVLVIGHGSGITAGSVLRHPVERADLVEISSAVLKLDKVFQDFNYHVLDDPRVHVYKDDGLSFLRTVPRRYDVIISEPSNPWIAGVADLFTVDFLKTAREKLAPGGVFTFWFHSYAQNDETLRMLLRTLGTVFPYALLFADGDFGNVIAVASVEPIRPDFAAMERRFNEQPVRDDLARLGITNLAGLLSHHRVSQAGAESLAGPGPVNTFGRQRLQTMAARAYFEAAESYFFWERDPLYQRAGKADILLDHYIEFRRDEMFNPMAGEEYEATARYLESLGTYAKTVAASIRARGATADRAP
ncbi:MAG: fused MFS/spermidine synthase [bacterium]|nr:fused MFS/spermidine synthase [bacterium]